MKPVLFRWKAVFEVRAVQEEGTIYPPGTLIEEAITNMVGTHGIKCENIRITGKYEEVEEDG